MQTLSELCRKNIVRRVMKGDWDLYDHLRERLPQSLWDTIEEECCEIKETPFNSHSGKFVKRKYSYRGVVHRENDKPAIIREKFFYGIVTFTLYTWCRNGIQSRDNSLPTQLTTNQNGNIVILSWHSTPENHPTQLALYRSSFEIRWKKGRLYHRDDNLPAIIIFKRKNINGNQTFHLKSVEWRVDGKPCRTGGFPTEIQYTIEGQISMTVGPSHFREDIRRSRAEKIYKEYSDEYKKYLHYFL